MRIVALIPSIRAENIRAAAPWLAALADSGIEPVIVANAASVACMEDAPARIHDSGQNPGFARSLARAALAVGDWDWLVILNDDLIFSTATAQQILEQIRSHRDSTFGLILLDQEVPRAIPNTAGVFASLSLLDDVARRLRIASSRSTRSKDPTAMYKSFSAAAISRRSWDELGGLDERFVFCFEDADFTRRHEQHTGAPPSFPVIDIHHSHSMSTKATIALVLPAIAVSAHTYLRKSGSSRLLASAVVLAALIVRAPLSLLSSAPRKSHLVGIGRSMAAVLTGREPQLPAYDQL